MSVLEDYKTIRNWFLSEWNYRTEVADENYNFTPPNNQASFVAFMVSPGDSLATTIGVNQTRNWGGVIVVTVYTKWGDGPGEMLSHVDTIHSIFRNKTLPESIFCNRISIQDVGRYVEGYDSKSVIVQYDSYKQY